MIQELLETNGIESMLQSDFNQEHFNLHVYGDALVAADGFWRIGLRLSLFAGPATANPPALPEDT